MCKYIWYVLHLNDVFMHTKSFESYINLCRYCDPQWNLCGCLSEKYPSYGSPRNTKKWQIVHHRFSPASTRVVFALHFSVFALSSWHGDLSQGITRKRYDGFVTSLMNMNMAKLRKPPNTSSIHWVSKVWNHVKNLKLEM